MRWPVGGGLGGGGTSKLEKVLLLMRKVKPNVLRLPVNPSTERSRVAALGRGYGSMGAEAAPRICRLRFSCTNATTRKFVRFQAESNFRSDSPAKAGDA